MPICRNAFEENSEIPLHSEMIANSSEALGYTYYTGNFSDKTRKFPRILKHYEFFSSATRISIVLKDVCRTGSVPEIQRGIHIPCYII
jgi:hypothetical protein